MTKDEWVVIWQYMLDRCTAANVTERNLKAYYDDLQEFDTEVVMQAAKAVVRQGNAFFPSLGILYQECLRLSPEISGFVSAHEAWEEVLQFSDTLIYSNELIKKVIKGIGGMYMLRMATQSEMISHRAQFISYYNQLVERARIDRISPKLLPPSERPELNAGKQSVVKDITGAVTQRLTTK